MGYGEAKNVPQNAIGQFLADKLYGARSALNENFGIPGIETGMGLGDLFMGESPEYIEDLSWGAPFIQPSGHGGRLDTRLGDVLGLPLPYAGAGKLLQVGGKKAIQSMAPDTRDLAEIAKVDPKLAQQLADDKVNAMFDNTDPRALKEAPVDEGKRKMLQGLGLAGVTAATGMPVLRALKGMAPEAVADVARPVANAMPRMIGGFMKSTPGTSGVLQYLRTVPAAAAVFKDKGLKGLVKHMDDYRGALDDAPQNMKTAVREEYGFKEGDYTPTFGHLSDVDEEVLRKALDDDININFLDDMFARKKTAGAGKVPPGQSFFDETHKLYPEDLDGWVSDPEGYGYQLWEDVVNSNATSLEEVKKAHLARAADDETKEIMTKIFDDPKFEDKLMDNYNRVLAHFNGEIDYSAYEF